MNQYFDIKGGKVTIHKSALGIPCFRNIWENEKDKSLADKYISYVVLNNHPDSPYVSSMESDKRRRIIAKELFSDENWTPSKEVTYAEEMYIEFLDTLILKMLRALRNRIESMSSYLAKMASEDMDLKMMKDILDIASKMEKAVKSITLLEKQVRKDEMESSRVQGGSDISHYEIPKGR